MRLTQILLAALAAFLLPSLAYAQENAGSGALSMTNLNISPNPVIAGSNVTISFQLYNSYTDELQNVNLQLQGSYPLLNFSPQKSVLISTMGQGLYNNLGSYFFYNVNIPRNAPTGEYTLNLVANYQTLVTTSSGLSSYTQEVSSESVMPITIFVHGIPNLVASIASSTPIIPGQQSSIGISLQNNGGGEAKNITVAFGSNSNFTVVGNTEVSIAALPSGGATNVEETLQASKYIESGTYYVPLSISYYSDTGKLYNETLNMPVSVVVNQPNVVVSLATAMPQELLNGYNQTLEFTVENIGDGEAKNISVSFYGTKSISIIGAVDKFFYGALEPGQSISGAIFIATNGSVVGNSYVSANLSYYSANYANSYSSVENLSVNTAPSAQFTIEAVNSSLVSGATNVPIKYVVKNTGNEAATGISFTLQSIYPITPVDNSFYLPELMPGQSANVTFLVSVDSHAIAGSYPVSIYEQWKQPNGAVNQVYYGSNNYFANVGASSSGNSGAYGTALTLLVIAIIVIALVALRRRAAARKKSGVKAK
ncbi:MAG: CARDB domain-containing protein [Candidatus Micrarchaeaceae archaeon]